MKFVEFFQENTEKFSIVRLVFFLWAVAILGIWVYTCIVTISIVPIDSSIVTMISILLTGKVTQRYIEK